MARAKKTNKKRGSKNFGRGIGTSHNRGSGNRGGFGNAGSGKKGDAKKPSTSWTSSKYFGKYSFGMNASAAKVCVNVSDINEKVVNLIAKDAVKGAVSLDLTKLGVEKLLGSGKISQPVEITVSLATNSAISKIEAAGGKVILPSAK